MVYCSGVIQNERTDSGKDNGADKGSDKRWEISAEIRGESGAGLYAAEKTGISRNYDLCSWKLPGKHGIEGVSRK